MPKENEEGQEKTEQPTSRRKGQARREGNVAKSQEINSAAVIAAGLSTLVLFGGWLMHRLTSLESGVFLRLGEIGIDQSNFQAYIKGTALWLLKTLLPIFAVVAVAGIVINLLQVGFLYTTKPLMPKFSKLNPVSGFKKVFNQQGAVRLLTNMIKVGAIGYVAFRVIKKSWKNFVPLMDATLNQIFLFLVHTILDVAIWTVSLLVIIGIIDYIYQKYKHIQTMKMSKQEVKEEMKMMEGDPKVKQKIRQMQFQLVFNAMIKQLPNADVVVTNPTHVAIALQYDPGSMAAPKVIGKGLRLLAQRIKDIARENDIPIVENPPLARALYKACEIGDEIPGQFYQDVAEIIAQIYELRQGVNAE